MNKRVITFFIAFLLVSSFFIRLFPLREEHWWDESVYLQHARIITEGRDNYSELNFRPPFLSVLFAIGFLIYDSEFTPHFVEAIINTLGILFLFLLVRKRYDTNTAILASSILAFSPFHIWLSRLMLNSTIELTFLIISTYFFLERKKYAPFISGFFFALAILTRFTSLIFASFFILLWLFKEINFKKLLYTGVTTLVFLAPYLIWVYSTFGNPLYTLISAHEFVQLQTSWTVYLWSFFLVIGLAGTIGLIFYLIFSEKSKFELALILFSILHVLYHLSIPLKESRYLLAILFPLSILSAKGFVSLFKKANLERSGFAIFGIFLFIVAVVSLEVGTIAAAKSVGAEVPHRISSYLGVSIILLSVILVFFIILLIKDHKLTFNHLLLFLVIFFFVFTILTVRDKNLVETEASTTYDVALYLRDNLPEGYIIYSNYRPPILAYYSNKPTVYVYIEPGQEEKIQEVFTNQSYYVFAENHPFNLKPDKPYVDSSPNFTFIKKIDDVYIYEFKP